MKCIRAAIGSWLGFCCLLVLAGCPSGGGGGGMGYGGGTPAAVKVTVTPATITLGQSAIVAWSSSAGTACMASGAWSGAQSAMGTMTVTPTSDGTDTYTLTCSGGAYTSATAAATLTVGMPGAASVYSLTNLVADFAGGTALEVDAHLVNPWGLSMPAGQRPAWTANNRTGTSTLYDGNGVPQPAGAALVVSFAAGATGTAFDPTGIVYNASASDFVVTSGGNSGAAAFVYAGEGGMIAGWSPGVDPTHAVTMYADTGGAVYKGLAIAANAGAAFLYAADFHNGKVDVFNNAFVKQTTSASSFTFADPSIPAGFAPFGIQAIANGANGVTQIYVTYAQQLAPDNRNNVNGAGLGYVDIYDTNGKLIKQLIATGALNSPWGLALAPADFGTFGNALLVGNFGDGNINAYDAGSGTFLGVLSNASGAPLEAPGLWGLAFGNDADNQPHNTLFFTAGPNAQADGAYGRIDPGATPPVLGAPPVVTLTVPAGNLTGTVSLSAVVVDPIVVAKVDFLVNSAVIGTATTAPYVVTWNTTTIADGQAMIVARATDVDSNVGSSAASTVTVANNAPAQVTLTQLQTQIFTPRCSICHTGSGSSLPGVQNLTAGNTFSNVVNVPSIEQPSLKRIAPNDPTNSYLIQKIEGAASISGSQMPFGCGSSSDPCLDQATIDLVKAWVSQGALNN